MKTKVALITLSDCSTHPAGVKRNWPHGEKDSRRKNEPIPSSWNILNGFGLLSTSVALACGTVILDTLWRQFFPVTLNTRHDLQR